MENAYTVIIVGGDRAGEVLGYFKSVSGALIYARVYGLTHIDNILILDPEGKEVLF